MSTLQNSFEEKAYNQCLNCVHIGKRCDGPNFLAMDMDRLSEWCRLRKAYLYNHDPKWTNAYIADRAMLSKISIDRFLSGNVDDIKFSTAARILRILVNGSWGQYPCANDGVVETETVYVDNPDLLKRLEEVNEENKRLQEALDKSAQERRDDVAAAHAEDHVRINYLKAQMEKKDQLLDERRDFLLKKDKVIVILAILLAVATLIAIGAVIINVIN